MIEVYADGSSTGRSDREGGWAYVILVDGQPFLTAYGGHPSTTNNLMELEAAIQGLTAVAAHKSITDLKKPIVLVSDSMYTLGIGNGTMVPAKNLESAYALRELVLSLGVTTRWVKGHSKDPWNERCDSLAKRGKMEGKAEKELMNRV